MSSPPLLEVSGLHAGYGALTVLRGVDFVVGDGEIVALLGANGAGKTTLNNVLSGLIRAASGSIVFSGERIETWSSSRILGNGLVHVPEGRKIFPNMTVRENLELGSYRRATANRKINLRRAYALFPRLEERAKQLAGTLSGGEQQMLAIGRGLMGEPKLIILDEPSLGLSPLLADELFGLIERMAADGLAVMLVEQNVMQSLDVASRAYVLENGVIAMSGAAGTLKTNPELARTYLGL